MNQKGFIRLLSALLSLALCLGGTSCAPTRNVSFNPNDPNADYFAATPIVLNPRFEILPAQSLHPSKGLWVRSSVSNPDKLAVRWDDFADLANKRNVDCGDFEFPNQNCQRCNACDTPGLPEWCNFVPIYSGFNPIQLYVFPWSRIGRAPTIVQEPMPTDGCAAVNGNPPRILIDHPLNGTYQLKLSPEYHGRAAVENIPPLAETRIRTVGGGVHLVQIPYELSRLEQPQSSPSLVFFSGTVPTGVDGVLQDNFSNRLSIGKVRVLKGTPGVDPLTGSFALTDWSVVKPSRLVFINNFMPGATVFPHNDGIHCYARYSSALLDGDGDLDLTRCRTDNNSSATQNLIATPVYLESHPAALLTWVVEFNQMDFPAIGGGEMPTLDPGQILAIEFRIL